MIFVSFHDFEAPENYNKRENRIRWICKQCDGVSVNDAIHQGPKLQRELFDVLLRFRRNPLEIACDISEVYLQIEIAPKDRPLHRFLWGDLNQCKGPEEYEFCPVVFEIN